MDVDVLVREVMDGNPREDVLERAGSMGAAIIPALLQAVRATLGPDGRANEGHHQPPVAALFVLAQHRVTQALPVCVAWLTSGDTKDGTHLHWTLRAAGGRLIASLCGDDAGQLVSLLNAPDVALDVACSILEALEILVNEGKLQRETLLDVLQQVLEEPHPPTDVHVLALNMVLWLGPSPVFQHVRDRLARGQLKELGRMADVTQADFAMAAQAAAGAPEDDDQDPATGFITEAAKDLHALWQVLMRDTIKDLTDMDAPLDLTHALAQWDLARPYLWNALQAVENPGLRESDSIHRIHAVAMLLMAQQRDRAAFPLLLKWMRLPDGIRDQYLGNLDTEFGDAILASCFDGNVRGLVELACDPKAGWGATTAVGALVVLAAQGALARDRVITALREIVDEAPRTPGLPVWGAVAYAAIRLHPKELQAEVETIVRDLQGEPVVEPEEVARALTRTVEECMQDLREDPTNHYITSAADAASWLEGPDKPPGLEDDDGGDAAEWEQLLRSNPAPYVRPEPKVGRNDPCPCGSGKKYKKCHLDKGVQT